MKLRIETNKGKVFVLDIKDIDWEGRNLKLMNGEKVVSVTEYK